MPRTSPRNKKRSSISSNNFNSLEEGKEEGMWSSKKKRSTLSTSTGRHNNNSSSSVHRFNAVAVENMFAEIADKDDPQTASMEGIFALGEKLGMDATEDIRILVLLWKMNVRDKPSQISLAEWVSGCTYLQVDTWDKLRALLPSLDTGFLDASEFRDFFKYCFIFSRQGTHKSLETDLVVALLKLILLHNTDDINTNSNSVDNNKNYNDNKKDKKNGPTTTTKKHTQQTLRVPAHRVESFTAFLSKSVYTHISLDQWTSFLDFCLEMDDDLSNYDETTSAWPVILDEYVEYMEEQMKNN